MTVPRQISVLTPPILPPSTSPGIFHQVIILLCASRALKHRCLTFAQVPKKYRSNLYPPNLLPTGNGEGSQLIYGPLPGPLWSFYPFCSSCSLLRATSISSSPQRSGTSQGTNYPLLICTFSFSHKCRTTELLSLLWVPWLNSMRTDPSLPRLIQSGSFIKVEHLKSQRTLAAAAAAAAKSLRCA